MKKISIIVSISLMMIGWLSCSSALGQGEELTVWSIGSDKTVVIGLKENTWPLIEKEFGVKIKQEIFPGISEVEFITKFVNAVRFGRGPDMIEANACTLSSLAYEGFLEPVPSWLDESLHEQLLPGVGKVNYLWDKDGYKKPFLGTMTRDLSGQVVFWNKEIYKEAGLDRSPLTWDEVFKFGKKLTQYNPDGSIKRSGFFFRTGGHIGGIGDKFHPYFLSAGGQSFLKLENGKIKANFNTPIAEKVVQFYLDGLYKYKIDAMGIPGDMGGWMREETATIGARRLWLIPEVQARMPHMYSKIGVGPIPVPEKGMKSITTTYALGIAVNAQISSERKELIWKICDRLNQGDIVKRRTVDIKSWLPYKSVKEEKPFTEEIWRTAIDYSVTNGVSRLEAPQFSLVMNILGKQLHLIFAKEKTIKEGLAAAAEEVNKIYEDITNLKEL